MADTGPNQWTLMFFFAGDNTLSPSMVSQLKAIKDAGFQENTTVIVRFDPNEKGAPTRIFEVNRKRKIEEGTRIGDDNDPFVRNLVEDNVTRKDIENNAKRRGLTASLKEVSKAIISELENPDTTIASDALRNFLSFCREHHRAQHYMLFVVGHGMIVGNDAFLPDESPDSAITLLELGEILNEFAEAVRDDDGTFELIGMHSCSLSAIEVAYQIKGTANYMMATEGISFVGSWPYRQLLKKFFNTIKKEREAVNIQRLLTRLHALSLHNSTDLMFAGFSADLCLCNLSPDKVSELNTPLIALTKALKDGLQNNPRAKELILLAHWKSQSYWQENYTDLYDFCQCLSKSCVGNDELHQLQTACDDVIKKLELNESKPFDALVVHSDHFGPTYQYSHGFSIYFPWSRPIEDGVEKVLEKYKDYAFTKELKVSDSDDDSWLSFLEVYFKETLRKTREKEDSPVEPIEPETLTNSNFTFNPRLASISAESAPSTSLVIGKTSPSDSGGSSCNCASIKNYPRDFSLSPEASCAFKPKTPRAGSPVAQASRLSKPKNKPQKRRVKK